MTCFRRTKSTLHVAVDLVAIEIEVFCRQPLYPRITHTFMVTIWRQMLPVLYVMNEDELRSNEKFVDMFATFLYQARVTEQKETSAAQKTDEAA